MCRARIWRAFFLQLEQWHGARVPFFLNCNEKLFFGSALFLGLPRHDFSRKDGPQSRKTRPAAFTLLLQLEQWHGAQFQVADHVLTETFF